MRGNGQAAQLVVNAPSLVRSLDDPVLAQKLTELMATPLQFIPRNGRPSLKGVLVPEPLCPKKCRVIKIALVETLTALAEQLYRTAQEQVWPLHASGYRVHFLDTLQTEVARLNVELTRTKGGRFPNRTNELITVLRHTKDMLEGNQFDTLRQLIRAILAIVSGVRSAGLLETRVVPSCRGPNIPEGSSPKRARKRLSD